MENQEQVVEATTQEVTSETIAQMEAAEKEMNLKAYEYIWNLLGLGETFSEEEYVKIREAQLSKDNYTNFDVPVRLLNMTMLIQGYGNFGRKFIEAAYEKDKDSCINMFESAIQEYLELDAAVKSHIAQMEASIQANATSTEDAAN